MWAECVQPIKHRNNSVSLDLSSLCLNGAAGLDISVLAPHGCTGRVEHSEIEFDHRLVSSPLPKIDFVIPCAQIILCTE